MTPTHLAQVVTSPAPHLTVGIHDDHVVGATCHGRHTTVVDAVYHNRALLGSGKRNSHVNQNICAIQKANFAHVDTVLKY